MIGLARGTWPDGRAMARSLGLFAGHPADSWHDQEHGTFASLGAPRGAPRRGWRPSHGPTGGHVLLSGAIDNHAELADSLALPRAVDHGVLYAHAVARWGEDADARIVGSYSAILAAADGTIRLSRSPWSGYSLFWAQDAGGLAIASMPRAVFAAGWPKRLRDTALPDLLFGIDNTASDDRFEGLHRVPQGAVLTLTPGGGARTRCWYDPLAVPRPAPRSDDAWVAAAHEALDAAARAAVAGAQKPGMLLSGGLDSPLAAEAVLRALPDGQPLPAFTFEPLPDWQDDSGPGHFASDRDGVLAMAAMHPRIEPHFTANSGNDFDSRLDMLLAASDAGYPSLAHAAIYHGPLALAEGAGCDVALTAGWGNATYSNEAPWAYLEFARRGHWRELVRLARNHPGDTRPLWRRLAQRSLMPHLPRAVQRALRTMVHGPGGPGIADGRLIRPDALRRLDLECRAAAAGCLIADEMPLTRAAVVADFYRRADFGTELHHATEEVFGLRLRDVAAYRPLIELCLGMPTRQFVRAGAQRFLARRMAAGRIPEGIRTEHRYGRHNADWHLRLTRRLPELREAFTRIARDPVLSALIDHEEGVRRIDAWPAQAPTSREEIRRHYHAITGALIVAAYWRHVSGSNAL